jgi:hypothetical protein
MSHFEKAVEENLCFGALVSNPSSSAGNEAKLGGGDSLSEQIPSAAISWKELGPADLSTCAINIVFMSSLKGL